MKKILFFDADGTMLIMDKGVPDSAKRAIEILRENGHMPFLCTGRARSFVPQELEQIPFSGIIAGGGTFIEYGKKVLLDYEVPVDLAFWSMQTLRECGMVPVMEGTHYMYYDPEEYTNQVDWYASSITQELGLRHRTIRGYEHDMHISKISAKIRPGCDYKRAIQLLEPYYSQVQHRSGLAGGTIEFIARGYSKGLSAAIMTAVLGFEKEDSIGFGDSDNDISLFEAVHTKVAMGDASENLRSMADYITKTAQEDGIYHGLSELGLL